MKLSDGRKIIDVYAKQAFGNIPTGDSITYYLSKEVVDGAKNAAKEKGLKVAFVYVRDSADKYYIGRIK